VTAGLGRKRTFTSTTAQSLLGWQPRPMEETVLDCARSLIAAGAA
jgi:dihydroflavonol-4-reductase